MEAAASGTITQPAAATHAEQRGSCSLGHCVITGLVWARPGMAASRHPVVSRNRFMRLYVFDAKTTPTGFNRSRQGRGSIKSLPKQRPILEKEPDNDP